MTKTLTQISLPLATLKNHIFLVINERSVRSNLYEVPHYEYIEPLILNAHGGQCKTFFFYLQYVQLCMFYGIA